MKGTTCLKFHKISEKRFDQRALTCKFSFLIIESIFIFTLTFPISFCLCLCLCLFLFPCLFPYLFPHNVDRRHAVGSER